MLQETLQPGATLKMIKSAAVSMPAQCWSNTWSRLMWREDPPGFPNTASSSLRVVGLHPSAVHCRRPVPGVAPRSDIREREIESRRRSVHPMPRDEGTSLRVPHPSSDREPILRSPRAMPGREQRSRGGRRTERPPGPSLPESESSRIPVLGRRVVGRRRLNAVNTGCSASCGHSL